ncbi:MAG: hypothetical protein HY785_11005 [Oscillatoriophycideae cyanobacterium NC_groundwater_1537_Pr4_S-0.65um_50_18]|nr:hypothetical protein [Oscillatoriophycideae cyanobacterium NC_groundwater_1537_Pr4_S-0.65um_50_18]
MGIKSIDQAHGLDLKSPKSHSHPTASGFMDGFWLCHIGYIQYRTEVTEQDNTILNFRFAIVNLRQPHKSRGSVFRRRSRFSLVPNPQVRHKSSLSGISRPINGSYWLLVFAGYPTQQTPSPDLPQSWQAACEPEIP